MLDNQQIYNRYLFLIRNNYCKKNMNTIRLSGFNNFKTQNRQM